MYLAPPVVRRCRRVLRTPSAQDNRCAGLVRGGRCGRLWGGCRGFHGLGRGGCFLCRGFGRLGGGLRVQFRMLGPTDSLTILAISSPLLGFGAETALGECRRYRSERD